MVHYSHKKIRITIQKCPSLTRGHRCLVWDAHNKAPHHALFWFWLVLIDPSGELDPYHINQPPQWGLSGRLKYLKCLLQSILHEELIRIISSPPLNSNISVVLSCGLTFQSWGLLATFFHFLLKYCQLWWQFSFLTLLSYLLTPNRILSFSVKLTHFPVNLFCVSIIILLPQNPKC